jgi:hypothetical protein
LIAVLYRIENDVIFEEVKAMDKLTNTTAVIFEKDSNHFHLSQYNIEANYWLYHKNVIEDCDEEKL